MISLSTRKHMFACLARKLLNKQRDPSCRVEMLRVVIGGKDMKQLGITKFIAAFMLLFSTSLIAKSPRLKVNESFFHKCSENHKFAG